MCFNKIRGRDYGLLDLSVFQKQRNGKYSFNSFEASRPNAVRGFVQLGDQTLHSFLPGTSRAKTKMGRPISVSASLFLTWQLANEKVIFRASGVRR